MKREKNYIVISRYAMRNNNIMVILEDTIEDALKDAKQELDAAFVTSVEIYESDAAKYCFFGRLLFKYTK